MKLIFPLSALTFFLFLAVLTHPGKRDETPQYVEKQDFLFKDFIHGTTITGSWINEDYMVKMEINSIRLDMKLVIEFTENMGSADIKSLPNDNRTPKHGKIHKFKEYPKYPQNATCQNFGTLRARSPGLTARVWDFSWAMVTGAQNKCWNVTVAMATRGWEGVTGLAEWFWGKVASLADGIWRGVSWMTERVRNGVTWTVDGVWNGVLWLVDRVWNGVTWTADGVWNGITRLAEWVWSGVTWLAKWIWNGVTWLAEGTWNGVTWVAEWIWNGLTWAGRLFVPGNYVTDGVVKFYYGYLDSHVNHLGARIAASTWQDVFYMMSAVFVVNFALLAIYLLISFAFRSIRRLWQARKDKTTAANPPPAPKKPIWRPKPKKKRRKNRNGW